MTHKIHRYTIPAQPGSHEIKVQGFCKVIKADQKPNEINTVSIWVMVDESKKETPLKFFCAKTNDTIKKLGSLNYLNTVFPSGSKFALHIFEVLQ